MSRITLDREIVGLSSIFEKLTRVQVIDCFRESESIYFIVPQGFIGKAIGKGGVNLKKLTTTLGKKVKMIEHHEDVVRFVKNVIYPLKVEAIVHEGDTIEIRDSSSKTKGALIGRGGSNLLIIQRAVRRFFPVEVKVV